MSDLEEECLDQAEQDAVETVLGPASRLSKRNVYFLGPYGRRVSFASQQRRALNLVWALSKTAPWKRLAKPKIAVVGGGIAGVMAAAACIMLDCEVWLYERDDDVLNLQRSTAHRTVHPSINFWPNEPLVCTTRFPFFDWYPERANTILGILAAEWETFEKWLAGLRMDVEVVDYAWDGSRVSLKLADGSADTADFVIVATGFGKELDLHEPEQPPYWNKDRIDRVAKNEERRHRCLVSGTGDGGLIDVLRLAFPGFMLEQKAVEFLRKFGNKKLSAAVRDIEETAAKLQGDKRGEYYATEYGKIAAGLPVLVRELLKPSWRHEIELVGKRKTPFVQRAAPVHKLLVAYAIKEKIVTYRQGEVHRKGKHHFIDESDKPIKRLTHDLIVIRHGTDDPLKKEGDEATTLRKEQESLSHLLFLAPIPDNYFLRQADIYPRRGSLKFAKRRRDLANSFLKTRHGVKVEITLGEKAQHPSAHSLGRAVVFEALARDDCAPTDLTSFPDLIFGIDSFLSAQAEDDAVEPVKWRR